MEKLNILIAEDDKLAQKLYTKAFLKEVFDISIANNGPEALEMYGVLKPDIIILDIFLPMMTGYLVLRSIREEMKDLSTAIVMATTSSEKEDVLDCLQLGIQGYVVKPFGVREIVIKVLEFYGKIHPDQARKTFALYKEALEKEGQKSALPPSADK